MNVNQAKQMDLVDYLERLGYKPEKIRGNSYWYCSPLRNEETPSFKVDRNRNTWNDFGDGRYGNLVDFGIVYCNCSVQDFLHKLASGTVIKNHQKVAISKEEEAQQKINVISVRPLISYALIKYLRQRRIPEHIARLYCKEVNYELYGKTYYAIGFKNDSGGYELRNPYIKAASSPKDITLIDNGAKDIAVFEGFFNFLSYRTMYDKQEEPVRNFLILNSTSFFNKALPIMQAHYHKHLYLDTDNTGQKFTAQALAIDKLTFFDERSLYSNYKDLNDWLQHIGQSQRQRLSMRL